MAGDEPGCRGPAAGRGAARGRDAVPARIGLAAIRGDRRVHRSSGIATPGRRRFHLRWSQRLARAGRDLRLLVVAEDWCTDSANTIPYVARLAALAGVELRILDRTPAPRS